MRTSLRRIMIGTGAAGLVLGGIVGSPAAQADTTTATFDVPAGTISIDAAVSTTLSTVSSSLLTGKTTISGSLGQVTVSDSRNSTAGWVATASAGTFTQQDDAAGNPVAAQAADTIAGSAASFTSPAAPDSFTGLVVYVQGLSAGEIGTATTTGSNEVLFTPSMSVEVPADTAAGTYSGTITTSVS